MIDYNYIESEVKRVLAFDKSGHSIEHALQVVHNAKELLKEISEPVNKDVVLLACYLHDVDDYKIVGKEQAQNLVNTHSILDSLDISQEDKDSILYIIKNMGYSKLLRGIRPKTLEGMIVSDADMVSSGADWIIRTLQFGFLKKNELFDIDGDICSTDVHRYEAKKDPIINYFFEKVLLLKDVVFTEPAKEKAQENHQLIYAFLESFFKDHYLDCSKWLKLLEQHK